MKHWRKTEGCYIVWLLDNAVADLWSLLLLHFCILLNLTFLSLRFRRDWRMAGLLIFLQRFLLKNLTWCWVTNKITFSTSMLWLAWLFCGMKLFQFLFFYWLQFIYRLCFAIRMLFNCDVASIQKASFFEIYDICWTLGK
jgi:hypothetical protein